jgi:uncharacterized protein YgbK (DUF1537 family)
MLAAVPAMKADALVIDIADGPAEARVGALLEHMAGRSKPLFVVGSSGVGSALVAHWQATGRLQERAPSRPVRPVDRLFVVSGSCSPATAAQIRAAIQAGFVDLALDPVALITEGRGGRHETTMVEHALHELGRGRSVVAHSSLGPDDPRERQVAAHAAANGRPGEQGRIQSGRALAAACAGLLQQVVEGARPERFVVAGGDTSTAAVTRLGIEALEIVAPLAPGAPLCRILHPGHALDGGEIVLKGGQIGGPDFFVRARSGSG